MGEGGGEALVHLGPSVAGRWYPAKPADLERQVDSLIESSAKPASGGPVRALIVPHAGYMYSGSVAASSFRLLRGGRFERVIVMGPSHYAAFEGGMLPDAAALRTPLGAVPVDTDAIARIAERPALSTDSRPFLPEHCVEAEIPFLQRLLQPGWRVVPLLVGGGSSAGSVERLAEALMPYWRPGTLVVVSSDFTHYGAGFRYVPFEDRVPERIEELDMGAVEHIVAGDCDGFTGYVERTGATICGQAAIRVLLLMLSGALEASLAAYDTSGRMTGSWDHSVSYAGVVFRGHAGPD